MKKFIVGAFLLLSACSLFTPAVTDNSVKTAQCTDFLRVMREGKKAGLPCSEYVAAARKAEPSCNVGELKCPDGGVN